MTASGLHIPLRAQGERNLSRLRRHPCTENCSTKSQPVCCWVSVCMKIWTTNDGQILSMVPLADPYHQYTQEISGLLKFCFLGLWWEYRRASSVSTMLRSKFLDECVLVDVDHSALRTIKIVTTGTPSVLWGSKLQVFFDFISESQLVRPGYELKSSHSPGHFSGLRNIVKADLTKSSPFCLTWYRLHSVVQSSTSSVHLQSMSQYPPSDPCRSA